MRKGNSSNAYVTELGSVFDEAPKSVLAAVAVSALTVGGDWLSEAQARFVEEWEVLWLNGIVSQKPSAKLLALSRNAKTKGEMSDVHD